MHRGTHSVHVRTPLPLRGARKVTGAVRPPELPFGCAARNHLAEPTRLDLSTMMPRRLFGVGLHARPSARPTLDVLDADEHLGQIVPRLRCPNDRRAGGVARSDGPECRFLRSGAQRTRPARDKLRARSRTPRSTSASNRCACSSPRTTSRVVPHSPQRIRIHHRSASRSIHETGTTKSRPQYSQSTKLFGRAPRRRARMNLDVLDSMAAALHRRLIGTIRSGLHTVASGTPIEYLRRRWAAAEAGHEARCPWPPTPGTTRATEPESVPEIGRAKRELEDERKTARYSVPDFTATRCTPAHRLER